MPFEYEPSEPCTMVQYEDACMTNFCDANRLVSKAEYRRCYPREARIDEWQSLMEEWARKQHYAKSGKTMPPRVLDDLCRRFGEGALYRFYHDYPDTIPAGYFRPSVRKVQQAGRMRTRAAVRRAVAHAQEV